MRIVPEHRRKNDIGDRFNRLVIAGAPFFAKIGKDSIAYAVCQCDCGEVVAVRLNGLRTGSTKSCGCLQADAIRKSAKERHPGYYRECATCGDTFRFYPSRKSEYCSRKCVPPEARGKRTHGMSYTRLHRIWCHMKTRCTCPTNPAWPYYGGRGISVCDEWLNSFESFRDWALVNGYADGLEIDRIDNDEGYRPGNCRWATRTQQASNRRKPTGKSTSVYKGVSYHAQIGRWRAQLIHEKKHYSLGCYATEIEAARAYNEGAKRIAGEFAHLNSI